MPSPLKVFARFVAHEKGLFAGAILVAGIAAALGVPFDFVLFGLTLAGVALFHHHTLQVALTGLAVIVLYKLVFTGFKTGPGLGGLAAHMGHEWVILTNLLGLLVGFALLSKHFEDSEVPKVLPKYLPDDWKGAFILLVMVFVLSAFLDNIAAALIGGAMAHTVFRGKVHIGYLAAIVACSNAGGSGSVVGDTTTTMMWLDGVSPLAVLDAYAAAVVALVVCGIPAALAAAQALADHEGDPARHARRLGAGRNRRLHPSRCDRRERDAEPEGTASRRPHPGDRPRGLGRDPRVVPLRKPDWSLIPGAVKGTVFLLALVTCASLMPVEKLPPASWQTAFTLGFVSAVFDNIPLTALALKQDGYDWGMLAYTVGFGGSMIWFGSSAGVAISNMYAEAKSVGRWLQHGWHVTVAYVVGFAVMLALTGWHPSPKRASAPGAAPPAVTIPAPGK